MARIITITHIQHYIHPERNFHCEYGFELVIKLEETRSVIDKKEESSRPVYNKVNKTVSVSVINIIQNIRNCCISVILHNSMVLCFPILISQE